MRTASLFNISIMTHQKDTRVRILEATKELLVAGNTNPSMAEIAKKTGITKSALYYFFTNKKDLFTALMNFLPQKCEDTFIAIAAEKIPPDQKLLKMMGTLLEQVQKERNVSQMIFQQVFANDHALVAKLFEKRQKGIVLIQSIVQEGIDSGIFRLTDAKKTAEIVGGYLDFLVMVMSVSLPSDIECPFVPKQLCEHLLSLLRA